MDNQVHNQIVSFIWGIADDCLRDVYVRGKYRDVILPMTVIRRLDALLEDSKEAVLDMKKKLDAAGIDNQWPALCNVAGQAFCNASPFRLRDLTSRAKKQTLKTDFEAYLDGFSPNVQEILEKFKFRNQIDTMIEADILGAVIEKFISSDINLSPNPVYKDEKKTILKHPGLDNHGMGTIFEELIRKFNEENNEEAGEHWTPRDVVELMADLIFMPIADQIKDATYSCYDGACGTGGMLTVAQDRLMTLAARRGKNVSIHLFGQEINPETYAICKADMLLKGDGDQAEHISYGSTLSLDGNATRQFDFMLSNPPYGKSWKTDAEKMGGKKEILDSRFNAYLDGGEQLTMIPRTSDGQLLFLLNNVAKMKKDTPLGSRIAEVHNGSSIFTGDAGSGESNARRYQSCRLRERTIFRRGFLKRSTSRVTATRRVRSCPFAWKIPIRRWLPYRRERSGTPLNRKWICCLSFSPISMICLVTSIGMMRITCGGRSLRYQPWCLRTKNIRMP